MFFCLPGVFGSLNTRIGNQGRGIQQSEPDHHAEYTSQILVDVRFGNQFVSQSVIHGVAVAIQELVYRCLIERFVVFVLAHHIGQCSRIGADDPVESPIFESHAFQDWMRSHGNAVPGVVCGHVGARTSIDHAHTEWN